MHSIALNKNCVHLSNTTFSHLALLQQIAGHIYRSQQDSTAKIAYKFLNQLIYILGRTTCWSTIILADLCIESKQPPYLKTNKLIAKESHNINFNLDRIPTVTEFKKKQKTFGSSSLPHNYNYIKIFTNFLFFQDINFKKFTSHNNHRHLTTPNPNSQVWLVDKFKSFFQISTQFLQL